MKYISFFLKFGITVFILYYLYDTGRIDPDKLRFYGEHPLFVVLFFGLFFLVFMPLASLRLLLIASFFGIRVRFFPILSLTWIGMFFNVTLPGAVTGDLIKGYYLKKDSPEISKRVIAAGLFLDRLTGLSGLIFLSASGLLLNGFSFQTGTRAGLEVFVLALCLGNCIFYGLYFYLSKPLCVFLQKNETKIRFFKNLRDFIEPLSPISGKKRLILWSVVISTLTQVFFLGSMIFIAGFVAKDPIPIDFQILAIPIGLIATAIPVAPGGLGVGHAAFESLYHAGGFENGANIFNLYILLYVFCALFGMIPYLLKKKEIHLPKN